LDCFVLYPVDKLPAGLEVMNTKLLGTETIETQKEWLFFDTEGQQNFNPLKYRMYHRYRWYDHENLRDGTLFSSSSSHKNTESSICMRLNKRIIN
jgi:hypothetical protein